MAQNYQSAVTAETVQPVLSTKRLGTTALKNNKIRPYTAKQLKVAMVYI